MTTTTTQALERMDGTPRAFIDQYRDSLAAVMPSHIAKPETWLRIAQGALKKGKKHNGGPATELEVAAVNNPGVFMAALLDAARLGLEPGTEQYYLTPRKVGGRNGHLEILGIVGYQGLIELMYRAGAVSSVVAECVYEADRFVFMPGRDEVPEHEIDWDADDRGPLRLVYAFARMKDGATSKVVVLNRSAIARIRAKSAGAKSDYSPWNTDEPAMWLKSGVRQLAKWVPTSAEYRLQAPPAPAGQRPASPDLDLPPLGDEYPLDDEVADGELVDDEPVERTYADDDPERPM